MVTTDFSPITQGDTPVLTCYFTSRPEAVFTLTNTKELHLYMINTSNEVTRECTGQWTIRDASAGLAYFHLSSDDTSVPGTYELQAVAISNDDESTTFLKQTLVIDERPEITLP